MKVLTVTLHPSIDTIYSTSIISSTGAKSTIKLRQYAAGKGVNAARVLQNLGVQVLALSYQGGETGILFERLLSKEGIPHVLIPCYAAIRSTTLTFNEKTSNSSLVIEPRQSITQFEADAMFECYSSIITDYDLCLLCGSGEGETLECLFYKMIEHAHQKRIPCLLDTSGNSLRNGVKAEPLFVKINTDELSEFMQKGIQSIPEQINGLKALIDYGVRFAAVTDQSKGMVLSDGHHAIQGSFSPDKVINTLGCGDAVLAGMAYGLINKNSIEDLIRCGVACGAANTQNFGAGFISRSTFEQFLKRIEVTPIIV